MSNRDLVYKDVTRRISQIEHGSSPADAKAELAHLRRGLGKKPGELPELWGLFLEDLPKELQGHGKEASPGELAVYTAMTLYGLGQQGSDPGSKSASLEGISFGRACGKVVGTDEKARVRMERKLKSVLASETVEDMATGIRGIINLMKDKDIRLDYPLLAADLYTCSYPEGKEWIRLKWARDFYRPDKDKSNIKTEEED